MYQSMNKTCNTKRPLYYIDNGSLYLDVYDIREVDHLYIKATITYYMMKTMNYFKTEYNVLIKKEVMNNWKTL